MHAEIKDSNEAFVLRYVPPLPSGGSGSQYQFLNGKISTQLKKKPPKHLHTRDVPGN